jgi:hypothetical protein
MSACRWGKTLMHTIVRRQRRAAGCLFHALFDLPTRVAVVP